MGVAAYNRGNRVISEQVRRDLEASRLVPVDHQYLTRLEDERAELAQEVARLRKEGERALVHLRERRATLVAERAEAADQLDRMTRRAHEAERAMLLYRRRWEWVSCLLRRVASPAAVAEARS